MTLNYGFGILFMKTRVFEFPGNTYLIVVLNRALVMERVQDLGVRQNQVKFWLCALVTHG